MVREELHDCGPSLVGGTVQCRAPGVGLRVRVETQVQQQSHSF